MPTGQPQTNAYLENKDECKEIIDVLIGNMGITQNNGQTTTNKPLRRSAREAIKSVFKDPEMGQDALEYFRKLKTSANAERQSQSQDDEQQLQEASYADLANADGTSELKQRISDTQGLLSDNTRNLKSKDYFNPRVVGRKKASIAAGAVVASTAGIAATGGLAAGVTVPAIAATIAAPALESIGTAAAISLGNIAAGYYSSMGGIALPVHTRQQNEKRKSVSKINPEKKVRADSKGIDDKYKDEMQQYQDLQLDYKDLTYEKMTGTLSKHYQMAASRLGHAIDSYVGVLDGMARGKTEEEATQEVNANKVQETPSGIAKEITSFIAGRSKDTFAEQVDESRNSSRSSERS